MTQVGLYARISDDTEGTAAGVERQVEDGEKIASVRRWKIAERYIDNDKSAYQRRVKRPRFEQMLVDLRTGKIDGIVAWDLDRFVRQPRDLERAIDIYEERKGLVFATAQGDVNLQTSDGRTMARVMVAFANKSSADTGRRTARKHLELARAGKPVGGRRPFGWQGDKATLNAREAAIVRRAVDEVLAGKTLTGLAREWNSAGIVTTSGGPWSTQALRNYLRNPRLVGLRTYQRRVLLDDEGLPVKGLWEPMLDQTTYDKLQLIVGKRGVPAVGRRGARKYMLSGLLRCGVCRGQMHGSKAREDGRFNYSCNNQAAKAAIKHTVSVSGHPVDRLIGKLVVARLQEERLESVPQAEWPGEAELVEVSAQIERLVDAVMDGTITRQRAHPRIEALERQETDMRNSRTQWLLEATGPAVHSLSLAEWEAKGRDERRALAEKVLSAIYVSPATRRTGAFDPERLSPVWREPPRSPLAALD